MENKKKRAGRIIEILERDYPEAGCHLNYENPFQLLISTILAAQCTDDRVNMVMGELYKKYKTPQDFINTQPGELENELKTISFFNQKSKSIRNCCKTLIDEFSGQIPQTMEELITLAGVGRKTANVVLGNCFGQPAIMTDTHLMRVSKRLELTKNDNPDKIEFDLKKIILEEKQTLFSHLIGEHGRQVCNAKKPLCEECNINTLCPGRGKYNKKNK